MRIKKHELAISYFQKAVSVGTYFPYVDMMLAQCKQELSQYKEAEFFFQKAIKANPKNPLFYTNYAKLLMILKRKEEARRQFEIGFEKGSAKPACVIPICDFFAKEGELKKAIRMAEQFLIAKEHPAVENLLTRLKLKHHLADGKEHYLRSIAGKFNYEDAIAWLAISCLFISSSSAEQDLINRCLKHWNVLNA